MKDFVRKDSMGKRKGKENMPELSQEVAAQMLSNIFEACEYEANLVPMDVLVSYTRYRRERHCLRWILLVLVILFWLVPVWFVTPRAELLPMDSTPGQPMLELRTDSWMPVDMVTASVAGARLPVYEMGPGVYQIVPDRNGLVKVRVTLINRQYREIVCQVDNVDVDAPVLKSSRRSGEGLDIFFEADEGIDYEGIYALTLSGERVKPISWDKEKTMVTFDNVSTGMNIYVPDRFGNVLHLVLTLH